MEKLYQKIIVENPSLLGENPEALFQLPEKVLQFGTGVLLRGLPDYIIDKANKAGIFNGRIAVVKSTAQGGTDSFGEQDNLYTVAVRGIVNGQVVKENSINAAISRVLGASSQWNEILKIAESEDLEIVISNTTEVGIVLEKENVSSGVPNSFPGKLLAVLYRRFKKFEGNPSNGLVIVPTELISDNGDKLKTIVLELANFNNFEQEFIDWLNHHNAFCNSLVDRIVPGAPKGSVAEEIQQELPYADDLLIMSEPYALWAISGDDNVRKKLSFVEVNAGAFVEPDITKFKELKLRLLNGTHTLTCGLAYLGGFSTVKEAMADSEFSQFLTQLMMTEIGPSIPYALSKEERDEFGKQVVDRFKNPYIEHFWINITLNYTQKIEMRIVSLLIEYYRGKQAVPKYMAAGLAAYIRFMKPESLEGGKAYGKLNDVSYLIQDIQGQTFAGLYASSNSSVDLVNKILSNKDFWGQDLGKLEGLTAAVAEYLDTINSQGTRYLIKEMINQG
jgi:tagaturonate reductase